MDQKPRRGVISGLSLKESKSGGKLMVRKNTKNDRPAEPLRGSKLSQMWLDGKKGSLHPAEEKLLEACASGQICVVGEVRPEKATKGNLIRAGFLRYLILGGCLNGQVHARGVQLQGAWIECDVGVHGDKELDLDASAIPQDFFILDCCIDGDINLIGATGWTVGLSGSSVNKIFADRLEIKGSVFLRSGFHSNEEVRLVGAKIGGQLDCSDGQFGSELDCHELSVAKGVFLNSSNPQEGKEFIAQGTVNFANATIGGNIECTKARINCKDRAFFANRADIKGDVSFDDARILGTVALTGAQIEGGLSFNRTRLNGKPSLQLRNSAIEGTLFWRDLKAVDGDVDLAGASCKTISFDRKSWQRDFDKPKAENNGDATSELPANGEAQKPEDKPAKRPDTKLDNFTYQGFNNLPSKADGKFWIDWLKVQPEEHLGNNFRPKPWAQLAGVLESMGYDGEAKKVLVEREWMLTRFMARHDPEDSTSSIFSFSWARVLWRRIWGWTIDFGYQPLKALWFLTLVILIGFGIFYWASLQGIMAPTHPLIFKEARVGGSIDKVCARNWVWFEEEKCSTQMPTEYSEFASFFYSADVALPIINLRQQEDWSPRVVDHNGKRIWSGYAVRLWEWLATVLGWVLSLMFVSAVGGFIRR